MIYVYFYKNTFQDKSIYIVFIFSNSTTLKLFMIYIFNILTQILSRTTSGMEYTSPLFIKKIKIKIQNPSERCQEETGSRNTDHNPILECYPAKDRARCGGQAFDKI